MLSCKLLEQRELMSVLDQYGGPKQRVMGEEKKIVKMLQDDGINNGGQSSPARGS